MKTKVILIFAAVLLGFAQAEARETGVLEAYIDGKTGNLVVTVKFDCALKARQELQYRGSRPELFGPHYFKMVPRRRVLTGGDCVANAVETFEFPAERYFRHYRTGDVIIVDVYGHRLSFRYAPFGTPEVRVESREDLERRGKLGSHHNDMNAIR